MEQSFPAGAAQHIEIGEIDGDLIVKGWDQQIITVSSRKQMEPLRAEDGILRIEECEDDLELSVPYETIIVADHIDGDAIIEGVQGAELHTVDGDVRLQTLSNEATLGKVGKDLEARAVTAVSVQSKVGKNAVFSQVERVALRRVGADLFAENVSELSTGHIGNKLEARNIVTLRADNIGSHAQISGNRDTQVMLGNVGHNLSVGGLVVLRARHIGNNCEIRDSSNVDIELGRVGNTLDIAGAARVQVGSIGNRCQVRDVHGDVTLGHVGSEAVINGIDGNVQVGKVGANAHIRGVHGSFESGMVGGNLQLESGFPPESVVRLRAGGNAYVKLPPQANVTVQASVGGSVRGRGIVSNVGHHVSLVYGDGSAHLEIMAGGNVDLQADEAPRSSSAGREPGWGGPFDEMAGFGEEMNRFGEEMSRFGQELGESISAAFGEAAASFGSDLTQEAVRVAERQRRKLEEQRRKLEEQRRHAQERIRRASARVNVRINDREWRMDPERVNRLIEQAQQAASEGILGAAEAVEQALKNLNFSVSRPSVPPVPPVPPTPPVTPAPPVPPFPAAAPVGPFVPTDAGDVDDEAPVNNDIDIDVDLPVDIDSRDDQVVAETEAQEQVTERPATSSANLEQEREAILRMIAEGRITPEEGDLLLEALG